MKKIMFLLILIILSIFPTKAQDVFAVKKWSGRYPTMNNDYPISFVCWKGWLPPIPHFFIRIYPSHYYYYLNSVPVYDTKGYVDIGLYQGLKLVIKEIDRNTISKTLEEITGTQFNKLGMEAIESLLRNSRLVNLPDIMGNKNTLLNTQNALGYLNDPLIPGWVNQLFEREIELKEDALALIKRMDCSQGDKLRAEEAINHELRELNGTLLYAAQKIRYWQSKNQMKETYLDFLAR